MFLTESYNYNTGMAISADPICGMQICLEAERAWFKLEKQMIKLEHTAIVNNNMELLREGEDGWWEKTKSWFKKTKETFLRYLDRVIDKWQEIQMRIKSRWMDVSKMLERIKHNAEGELKDKEVTIQYGLIQSAAAIAEKGDSLVNAVKDMGTGDNKDKSNFTSLEIISEINKIAGTGNGTRVSEMYGADTGKYSTAKGYLDGKAGGKAESIKLTDETKIKFVLDFLKDKRQKAIDTLKKCRNEGEKLLNRGISEGNARDEEAVEKNKQCVSMFKNAVNGYIIAINKASVQALKIFSIAATKNIKADKFKKKMDNIDSRIGESFTPYNILDQF